MYSYRIEQAIRAAAVLHEDQTRRGDLPLPYITHPFSVAMSLLKYTDDEDVIVAALLHDTLEDTEYTYEQLVNDFGEITAEIVATVSEPQTDTEGQPLSWRERKNIYREQVATGPQEALYVSASDKIHNFRAIIEEYYDEPERFLEDFGTNISERIATYSALAEVITEKLDNEELKTDFNYIFNEYKNFLNEISELYEVS